MSSSCCSNKKSNSFQFDPILHGSSFIIIASALAVIGGLDNAYLLNFVASVIDFLSQIWWGIALGFVFVGLTSQIPKNYFQVILGAPNKVSGLFKAALAGLMFDLCSHGILMVGAKLYERGASFPQVIAFLIASPWNSFSLTLILVGLIGWQWTLIFIAGSAVIAILTGYIALIMTQSGKLAQNPNTPETTEDFDLIATAKADLKTIKWNMDLLKNIVDGGKHEAKILLKWLLLGVVMASAIRTFLPADHFQDHFGPTLMGLGLTLVATTIIEVCSEGSSPIAADLFNKADAPGNAFTFLMAGVSTDYTEMMVLKDTTGSWKMAFILPLISVPQIVIIGYLMNLF